MAFMFDTIKLGSVTVKKRVSGLPGVRSGEMLGDGVSVLSM
jgi:hypothetical protein